MNHARPCSEQAIQVIVRRLVERFDPDQITFSMPTHLYLAPAAAGKTAYILNLARRTAEGLAAVPRVVVATHLQERAARRRLAEMGGAIGVRVLTLDRLYAEILSAVDETYVELSDAVQYRLLRALLDSPCTLRYYAPIADRPGFIQVLQQFIRELKAAGIHPDDFVAAVRALGDEPRLAELAQIYGAYQAHLGAQGWADRGGLGWLAVEALRERAPHIASDWSLLAVDGFDNFTPVQGALLGALAGRVSNLVITLTGDPTREARSLAHRRYAKTKQALEAVLHLRGEPLPPLSDLGDPCKPPRSSPLIHLERELFRPASDRVDGAGAVEMVEAADRAGEVRAALRWLKARLLLDGLRPGQIGLLARNITPYRPFILQTAAEFGLPIRLADGLPLRENPAVAALLGLLEIMLPTGDGEPALPRRPVVDAWRSPYFDWSALPHDGAPEPVGITPADADDLDAVARWGRVLGGLAQWSEALDRLVGMGSQASDPAASGMQDEERGVPAGLLRGDAASVLAAKFDRFLELLAPPSGVRSYRQFVGWLEALIGEDASPSSRRRGAGGQVGFPAAEEPMSLRVVARARAGDAVLAERDLAALVALKDVLRGLVWAEEALASAPVDYPHFIAELTGAVDAASYTLPIHPDREEILVADVVQARGLPFRTVAVLGLAEGEFPATLGEDPFLRDADRKQFREVYGLPLEPSTQSAEAEFFYETAARPSERLLLTRPRLADDGAPWQSSPFWEETLRRLQIAPSGLTTESVPPVEQAASWPELVESLATAPAEDTAHAWAAAAWPGRWEALEAATGTLQARLGGAPGPLDGGLDSLAPLTALRFGAAHTWSAGRLETYRRCPFSFFVAHVLGLEPRQEPVKGLDRRQLGNIYHRILELLYRTAADPSSLEDVLAALPGVAQSVLDEAPNREGFRASAWWAQTRRAITEDITRSVTALAALSGEFRPIGLEARFWGSEELQVVTGEGAFRLHGIIDRIDRAPDGGLRIIDYKTAGPWTYTRRIAQEGTLLQLPLYALAARDALRLGDPVDGFYWHVRHSQPSDFTLAGGAEAAIEQAVTHAWEAVRGARSGRFAPHPPPAGCPDYCAAASFCWHFRPAFRG